MRPSLLLQSSALSLILAILGSTNRLAWSLTEQQVTRFDRTLNEVIVENLGSIYGIEGSEEFEESEETCFGVWVELKERVGEPPQAGDPNQASSSRPQQPVLPARPDVESSQLLTDVREWASRRAHEEIMKKLIDIINRCLPIVYEMSHENGFAPALSSSPNELDDDSESVTKEVEYVIDEGTKEHLEKLYHNLDSKQSDIDKTVERQKKLVESKFGAKDRMDKLMETHSLEQDSSSSDEAIKPMEIIKKNIADLKRCESFKERTLSSLRSFGAQSSGSSSSPKDCWPDMMQTMSDTWACDSSDFPSSSEDIQKQLHRCKSELRANQLEATQHIDKTESQIETVNRHLARCQEALNHISVSARFSIERFNESVKDEDRIK